MAVTDGGIEQATGHPEEHPGCNSQRQSERNTDKHQLVDIRRVRWCQRVGDLCGGKCEVEEERGSDKFARHSDQMSSNIVIQVSISIGISSGDLLAPRLLSLRRIVPGTSERIRHLRQHSNRSDVGRKGGMKSVSEIRDSENCNSVYKNTLEWNISTMWSRRWWGEREIFQRERLSQ